MGEIYMNWRQSFRQGIHVGLKTTWELGKIIFPITLFVSILQHTPILHWLIELISPLMSYIGLSGDAAIPLVLGNFLNLYAGIGAILSLQLTVKEVFILAVMLSFSHNLLVESSVAKKVGVKIWVMVAVRLGLALISAFFIHLLWEGGSELAQYGMVAPSDPTFSSWGEIALYGLQSAAIGVFQLALIVIPLMMGIQFMKDLKWLQQFSKWVAPFTKILGMSRNTSTTLAAGLLFGLAYGAGVMIQAVKEDGVSSKDVTLAFIFLVACHAVIEDTLIFIPLGIPVWPLLLIRVIVAIIITCIVSLVWRRLAITIRKEASL
jgi:hypothetical protein